MPAIAVVARVASDAATENFMAARGIKNRRCGDRHNYSDSYSNSNSDSNSYGDGERLKHTENRGKLSHARLGGDI